MGSILNFVFPYPKDEIIDWCITGPITTYIESYYPHTYNLETQSGETNVIVFEPFGKFNGFIENINTPIRNNVSLIDFLKNQTHLKIIIASIADPAIDYEKERLIKVIREHKLEDRTFYIESNLAHKDQPNTFVWNFFLEEASKFINRWFNALNHNSNQMVNHLGYPLEEIKEEQIHSFRNKKFLCFNRTVDRQHRLSLLHDYIFNDFSDSYFSFLVYNTSYESIFHYEPTTFDCNIFHQYLPIELDTQNLKDKSQFRTADAIGKPEFYLNSCINLVTETSFIDNELFISEKIVKPILNYQPFIVFGPVGYLTKLKELGYKTFSDFWDESYDEIEIPKDRYFKIMEVVFDLNSKSIEELNEIYNKTKEICIHNRKVFMETDYSVNPFLESLKNE